MAAAEQHTRRLVFAVPVSLPILPDFLRIALRTKAEMCRAAAGSAILAEKPINAPSLPLFCPGVNGLFIFERGKCHVVGVHRMLQQQSFKGERWHPVCQHIQPLGKYHGKRRLLHPEQFIHRLPEDGISAGEVVARDDTVQDFVRIRSRETGDHLALPPFQKSSEIVVRADPLPAVFQQIQHPRSGLPRACRRLSLLLLWRYRSFRRYLRGYLFLH